MGRSVLLNALNINYGILYIKELVNQFSLKFTLLCVSVYFGGRGALKQFATNIELPLYLYGGWDSTQYQTYMAVSTSPMNLKSICGILTDLLPIFGYEKSSWMLIYTTLGTLANIIFVVVPMNKEEIFVGLPSILLFFIQMEAAFNDLLVEGKYVQIMNNLGTSRGNIVSFMYFMVTLGEIIPHFLVGSLVDILSIQHMFAIMLPFSIQPIFFILAGCMINDKASKQRNNKIDFVKLKTQRRIMFLASFMFVSFLGSTVVALSTGPTNQFIYVVVVGILCVVITYFTLPTIIANINLYIFLAQLTFLNITGSLEYYYTADNNCIDSGPHFSMIFMKTYAGITVVVAKLVAIWFFQAILTHYTYRISFWTTTLLRCIASIVNIIIISRWNLKIGISDELFYLIGNAFGIEMAYMMDHMPAALMMAKLCPKNVEGTVFAILAGFGNFGQSIARFGGGFLMEQFGVIIGDRVECNIDNLILIIVIGHLILPLVTIPLVFLLVPNYMIREDIAYKLYMNSKYYKTNSDPIATTP